MITVSPSELRDRVHGIFTALGANESVSTQVAWSLVESNLAGHDSHGVIRVPWYVRAAQEGSYHPNAEIRVVRESASTALLDCGYTYGQVGATRGMELAIEKARQHDIGMVVLQHSGHIGRLGEYVVTAARAGMMGTIYSNGSRVNGLVAPYGGVARALYFRGFEWKNALDHAQVPALIVKHVLAICFVAIGAVLWKKYGARASAILVESG